MIDIMCPLSPAEVANFYVTSDTHFGHRQEFLFGKRGYASPEDMDVDMIQKINQTVGPNGILLHHGDFCLNTSADRHAEILSQLNIKELWLIYGNHNNPHLRYTHENYEDLQLSYKVRLLGHYFAFGFKTPNADPNRKHKHNIFVSSHFPFAIWDGMSKGVMHLCGHSHGSYPLSTPGNLEQKILDCGWDVHGRPLHINEVLAIMKTKNRKSIHHDAE